MIKKEGRKGVAMIMVLAMLVIFAALIITVVISSTTSARRAHFYKDRSIALQIAYAGIQDTLYWLNYKGYYSDYHYPMTDLTNPPYFEYAPQYRWFNGSTASDIWLAGLGTDGADPPNGYNYNPSGIANGRCEVEFVDNGTDTITATGTYNGRQAIVRVQLRGNSGEGNTDHNDNGRFLRDFDGTNSGVATWGIAEAFNKHTIYAGNVTFPATPLNIEVYGNITTSSDLSAYMPSLSDATWTQIAIDIADMHFDAASPNFSLNLSSTGVDDIYDASGNKNGTPVNILLDGVYWDGVRYHFGMADDGVNPEPFDAGGNNISVDADVRIPFVAGSVTIDGYFSTTGSLDIEKDIITATGSTYNYFDVAGTLNITTGITITGDLKVKGQPLPLDNNIIEGEVVCDQDITVNNGCTINGDVKSEGTITVDNSGGEINGDMLSTGLITFTSGTINGSIVSQGDITINGGTIDASGSAYDAAVYIYNDTGVSGEITITGSPTIRIDEDQKAGIAVYLPTGTGTIDINSGFTLNYLPDDTPDQFAIVNDSGTSNVNINAALTLIGSIYSSGDITLNNTQNIEGILVAGNTVTIGNNSTITYDEDPYLKNAEIYKGFKGGRRRYIPSSWKIMGKE